MSERIICNENGGELREEIVRCRDCAQCEVGWCCKFDTVVRTDGFCAWGVRRDI